MKENETSYNLPDDDNFDRQWRAAFSDALVTPEPGVWQGISKILDTQKPPLWPVFCKIAASVLLVLLPLGVPWHLGTGDDKGFLSGMPPEALHKIADNFYKSAKKQSGDLGDEERAAKMLAPEKTLAAAHRTENLASAKNLPGKNASVKHLSATKGGSLSGNKQKLSGGKNDKSAPKSLPTSDEALAENRTEKDLKKLSKTTTPPFAELLERALCWSYPVFSSGLSEMPASSGVEKKRLPKVIAFARSYAGVSYYTSSFKANRGREYTETTYTAGRQSDWSMKNSGLTTDVFEADQSESPLLSYTVGVGGGLRIFERLVVQGGVSYNVFRSTSVGHFTVADSKQKRQYPLVVNAMPEKLVDAPVVSVVNKYEIESVQQYLSIPLEVGAEVIGGRHGLLLKTGISADIFLKSRVSGKHRGFDALSILPNDSYSSYKPLSWSASLGAELSLIPMRRSTLFLAGNYRFSLQSISKSSSHFSNKAQIFTLGLSFRYLRIGRADAGLTKPIF